MTIEIPASEQAKFAAELERKKLLSKKTNAEIVNHAGQNMAFQALLETKKTSPDKIAYELGHVGQRLQFSKTGKILKKSKKAEFAQFKDDSLAARLINARRKAKDEPLLFGDKLNEAIRKLVAARKRSSTFISSGWISSIRQFARYTGTQLRTLAARQRGRPKGYAEPAKEDWIASASTVNTATKDSPRAGEVAQAGLSHGTANVIADMQVYAERKLQEAMDK